MIFGLFGGAKKKRERELRVTLSLQEFEAEFPKTLSRFKIQPSTRAGKSASYNTVEGAASYIVEQGLITAMKDGKAKTLADLTAAATYCGLVIEFLGSNAGLTDNEIREMQALVCGTVFARVATSLFKPVDLKTIVSKGMIKAVRLSKRKSPAVDAVCDAMRQFVTKRDAAYLAVLSRTIEKLH